MADMMATHLDLIIVYPDHLHPVLTLKFCQDVVQVVTPSVVDEEAADVRLDLVADRFRYCFEISAVFPHPCGWKILNFE